MGVITGCLCRRCHRRSPLVSFAACLLLSSALLHASPLGVSPQDEKYYLDGAVIACRDGSKSFSRNRLNDGFCDCPDGTDEPGTSACPESKFYCRNSGATPRFLFSSRVNDQICDCCDGSDEYEGGVVCLNTCTKDGNSLIISIDEHDPIVNILDGVTQRRKSRLDMDDFIQNLKGFRIAIIIELIAAVGALIFCLFYRRHRARRRRILRRN